ncbi:unnamed protein product [Cyclocybe aegerita]|uniref:Uncharacterized protein n=1 Tax=Cyclocybe aegerita TaxID=1973307 RepID=A0A8S0WJ45_CYCAE|nr:unnamed protein product [Cyclocybe aegerita]
MYGFDAILAISVTHCFQRRSKNTSKGQSTDNGSVGCALGVREWEFVALMEQWVGGRRECAREWLRIREAGGGGISLGVEEVWGEVVVKDKGARAAWDIEASRTIGPTIAGESANGLECDSEDGAEDVVEVQRPSDSEVEVEAAMPSIRLNSSSRPAQHQSLQYPNLCSSSTSDPTYGSVEMTTHDPLRHRPSSMHPPPIRSLAYFDSTMLFDEATSKGMCRAHWWSDHISLVHAFIEHLVDRCSAETHFVDVYPLVVSRLVSAVHWLKATPGLDPVRPSAGLYPGVGPFS